MLSIFYDIVFWWKPKEIPSLTRNTKAAKRIPMLVYCNLEFLMQRSSLSQIPRHMFSENLVMCFGCFLFFGSLSSLFGLHFPPYPTLSLFCFIFLVSLLFCFFISVALMKNGSRKFVATTIIRNNKKEKDEHIRQIFGEIWILELAKRKTKK